MEKDGNDMENKMTVVLADANDEFRLSLQQTLEASGEFDVVGSVPDGVSALALLTENRPKLLVMDLLLPELDGFGLLEQAAKEKLQMKTIVVSALYRDQVVSQAMNKGVSFFMPKPCARLTTQRPMAPRPIMPMVLPYRSMLVILPQSFWRQRRSLLMV